MFIILSKTERDAIRGNSSPFAAIEPVELSDGTFVIGEEVVSDPHHDDKLKRHPDLLRRARVNKSTIDSLIINEELKER